MSRSDTLYIQDMIESATAVRRYLETVDYETFITKRMIYSATIRELEIIGEASSKLSDAFRAQHPSLPWRQMKDFRNVLAHEYFGVDSEIVWDIATQKIPELLEHLEVLDRE